MKKSKLILLTVILLVTGVQAANAGQAVLTITANVPPANDVGFFVSRVTRTGNTVNFDTPILGSQQLNFGTLTFSPTNGIFIANHFYAIDVGAIAAGGSPAAGQVGTVQLSYVNGTPRGLGNKAITTFVRVTGAPGSQTETTFARHTLANSNLSVQPAQFAGGFLRIYLGINTGEVFATFPVEASGSPFTTADAGGDYTGTLTLTSTLQ